MAKQFKIKQPDKPNIPFEIVLEQYRRNDDGQVVIDSATGEPELVEITEKFTARGTIPGVLMMNLAAAPSPTEAVARMVDFLVKVLVPEDRERYQKLLEESDPPIDMTQIGSISEWLVEQYGENPTG